jgi:hypothetical protein
LLKSHESWIRLAEDGVTVSWNDPSALEYAPDVLLDLLRGRVVADLLLHAEDEAKNLLVGEAVEGPSETGETGRVGEERVRERRSDEVDGVRRDVSSLVISCAGQSTTSVLPVCLSEAGGPPTVQSIVETDDLNETLAVAESDLVGKVPREILALVNGRHVLASVHVLVAVNASSDGPDLGREVEHIFGGRLPVL